MATTTEKVQNMSYEEVMKALGITIILPEDNDKTMDAIIGLPEAKKHLSLSLKIINNPDNLQYQKAKKYRNFLFAGEQGSGRSLIARAFAKEANFPFIEFNCERLVVDKPVSLINSFEQILQKFNPAVIHLKKIDSVMKLPVNKYTTVYSKLKDYLNNYSDCFFFASAELDAKIPDIIFSKDGFNFILPFEDPDLPQREALFKKYLERYPYDKSMDINKLAKNTLGVNAGQISILVSSAYNEVLRNGKELIDFEVLDSVLTSRMYGYKKKLMTEKERRLTAYHEAGHVIAGFYTNPDYKIAKVEIAHRSETLGLTFSEKDEDKLSATKEDYENYIILSYGGLAAERLILGTSTSGVYEDLESATIIAANMVMSYGMSEELGPIHLSDSPEGEFYSDTLNEEAHLLVQSLLKKLYERTERLLLLHKDKLIELSEALLEKETLYTEDIVKILGTPN